MEFVSSFFSELTIAFEKPSSKNHQLDFKNFENDFDFCIINI